MNILALARGGEEGEIVSLETAAATYRSLQDFWKWRGSLTFWRSLEADLFPLTDMDEILTLSYHPTAFGGVVLQLRDMGLYFTLGSQSVLGFYFTCAKCSNLLDFTTPSKGSRTLLAVCGKCEVELWLSGTGLAPATGFFTCYSQAHERIAQALAGLTAPKLNVLEQEMLATKLTTFLERALKEWERWEAEFGPKSLPPPLCSSGLDMASASHG